MNILLSSKIDLDKRNDISIKSDLRLFKFFDKCFNTKNNYLTLFDSRKEHTIDLIVISGGNDIIQKKIQDKIRYKLTLKSFLFGLNNEIPILGICYGAQFIASYYKFQINKILNHVGNKHFVYDEQNKNKRLVNSYHNYAIKYKKSNYLKPLFFDNRNNVESFEIKNKNIIGMMWHPEREKKINSKDTKMIKKLCN